MQSGNKPLKPSPVRAPREGWDEAFAQMAVAGDDALLLPDEGEDAWAAEEWHWHRRPGSSGLA